MSIQLLKQFIYLTTAGLLLLWSGLSDAVTGSINIAPVRLNLSAEQSVTSLVVSNQRDQAIILQAKAMRWTQKKGGDVYTDSRDILVTPLIVKLPPRSTQIIRVATRRPPAHHELAYRIFFQEVLPRTKPSKPGVHIHMVLRIGIPLFITPLKTVPKQYVWHAQRLPHNLLQISLTNKSNAHLQVIDFTVTNPGSKQPIAVDGTPPVYVLPGRTAVWKVKLKQTPGKVLHVNAKTDSGDISADIHPSSS